MNEWKPDELPTKLMDWAKERTRGLIKAAWCYNRTSINALLASAYLQGMRDAVQVLEEERG